MSNNKNSAATKTLGETSAATVSARPVLQIISLLGLIPWELFNGIPTRQFLSLRL